MNTVNHGGDHQILRRSPRAVIDAPPAPKPSHDPRRWPNAEALACRARSMRCCKSWARHRSIRPPLPVCPPHRHAGFARFTGRRAACAKAMPSFPSTPAQRERRRGRSRCAGVAGRGEIAWRIPATIDPSVSVGAVTYDIGGKRLWDSGVHDFGLTGFRSLHRFDLANPSGPQEHVLRGLPRDQLWAMALLAWGFAHAASACFRDDPGGTGQARAEWGAAPPPVQPSPDRACKMARWVRVRQALRPGGDPSSFGRFAVSARRSWPTLAELTRP